MSMSGIRHLSNAFAVPNAGTLKKLTAKSQEYTSEFFVLATLFVVIVCYTPVMGGMRIRDRGNLPITSIDPTLRQVYLCSVGVIIPMIIECFLDLFYSTISFKFNFSRLSMLICVGGSFAIQFFVHDEELAPELLVCSYVARSVICLAGFLSFFHHKRTNMSIYVLSIIAVVLTLINALSRLFVSFQVKRMVDNPGLIVLVMITSIGAVIFTISACLSILSWGYNKRKSLELLDYYLMVTACIMILAIVVKFPFAFSGNSRMRNFTDKEWVAFSIMDIFFVTLFTIFPGRIAKQDAVQTQNKLQAKRNFVRYISHEIRTPLNTVYMGLQLVIRKISTNEFQNEIKKMRQDTNDDNDISTVLTEIMDSCQISIDILNDLLLYDKLEDGKMILECRHVNAKSSIENVLKPFCVQAQSNNTNFIYIGDEYMSPLLENTTVFIDQFKFGQVVRNMVSNALKFTPPGKNVHVYCFLMQNDERVDDPALISDPSVDLRIEVHDEGPGISKENQQRLFKEIIQFNAAELQGGRGSGLGLWISNAIVASHGGKLSVFSEGAIGQGSVFFLQIKATLNILDHIIPLERQSSIRRSASNDVQMTSVGSYNNLAQHDPSSVLPPRPGSLRADSGMRDDLESVLNQQTTPTSERRANYMEKKLSSFDSVSQKFHRALVVDDSTLSRKMVANSLKSRFLEISQAMDGIEAVAAVQTALEQNRPFDVIFMDSIMPNMNGIEATKIIRSLGFMHFIIGITGNVLQEDINEFMDAGANDVLQKPLNLQHLDKALSDLEVHYATGNDVNGNGNGIGSTELTFDQPNGGMSMV